MADQTAAQLAAAQRATAVASNTGSQKVLTGARALVEVGGVLVGCFDSCTWTSSISTETVHTLGRYSAHEVVVTAYEQVDVNCSGFRVMGANPHDAKGGGFPLLSNLLALNSVTIQILDRGTATGIDIADATKPSVTGGTVVMTVTNCVPTSYSSGVQAKSAARFQISYRGIRADYSSDAGDGESASAIASLI